MHPQGRDSSPGYPDFDELEPLDLLPDSPSIALRSLAYTSFPAATEGLLSATVVERNVQPTRTSTRRRPASAAPKEQPTQQAGTSGHARSQSLPVELPELGIAGTDRARERNKKAQRTFRQRQKVADLLLEQARLFALQDWQPLTAKAACSG